MTYLGVTPLAKQASRHSKRGQCRRFGDERGPRTKHVQTALFAFLLTWTPSNLLWAEPVGLEYQFSHFYQQQDHTLAPALLQEFFSRFPTVPPNSYWPAAFFFSRVFLGDDTYEKLAQIYRSESKPHKAFLLDVFYLKATPQTKPFLDTLAQAETDAELKTKAAKILGHEDFTYDPLEGEITQSNQLDMLWTVFLTSGDLKPVDKIAGVLGWRDITRQKVSGLYRQSSDGKEGPDLLKKFGLEVPEAGIKNIDDLDIRLVQYLQQGKLSNEFQRLRTILAISDQDVYQMAIKGSAFWALRSNAQQHEAVLAECKRLVADPAVPGYTMLRVLVASVER